MATLHFRILYGYLADTKLSRIDTVQGRAKLQPRRPPYWQKLTTGLSLGYRRMSLDSEGAWLVAIRDPATGTETRRSLGGFAELPQHQRFDAAKKAAEALASHIDKGGSTKTQTVREAGDAYVKHLQAENRNDTANDLVGRLKRWVDNDKLGGTDVRKLNAAHVQRWRQGLIAAPVIANIHAAEDMQRKRKRAPASINRDMAALRAVLNHALRVGVASTDAAWRVALEPLTVTGGRRTVYLTREQRASLLEHAEVALVPLLRCLSLLPLRPGAAAALTVADLNADLGTLSIHTDKAAAGRTIKLPPTHLAFFKAATRGKPPGAHLFTRADGKPWNKDVWKGPMQAAAREAKLPAGTVLYSLRHAAITDLIVAGCDPLTVSRISGTSLAMIQKTYGHLSAAAAESALATLAV